MKIKNSNSKIIPQLMAVNSEMFLTYNEIREYLRVEQYEDEKLTAYYETAVNFLESFLKCDLKLKTFKAKIFYLNKQQISLPSNPIHQVLQVQYLSYGQWAKLDDKQYAINNNIVYFKAIEPLFSQELQLTYQAGYTTDTLPKVLKQAILEYILFSFNHETKIPDSIINLCQSFKVLKI